MVEWHWDRTNNNEDLGFTKRKRCHVFTARRQTLKAVMTINITQRIQLAFLLILVKAVYALDVLTGKIFEKIANASAYLLVVAISSSFLAGIAFTYKTGYLQQVSNGYLAGLGFDSTAGSNVLGAKSMRKDLPLLVREAAVPDVTAKAVLIVDKTNTKTLYEKNSGLRYASASTTKLITALVVMDIYKLDDIVTVSKRCTEVGASKAGLPEGTTYKVKDLLYAMLISSSGDAACALAEGKVNSDEFLYLMNQKAYKLK